MKTAALLSASPIGDTRVDALPARSIGPAVGYYVHVLGFSLVERTETTAKLRRDEVEIGVAVNGDDPEQASVYFGTDNIEALRAELDAKGIEPSPLRTDSYGGNTYRVCFAQDPYGVCFCFGQKVTE